MKKKLYRGIAVLLAMVLMLTVLSGTVTVSAETVKKIDRVYRGTFSYYAGEENFYYSDSYFVYNNESTYNHLRTLSAAVAFGIMGSSSQEIVNLMTDMGMDTNSIALDDLVLGTHDTIGTAIAHKYIEGVPLVVMAIRGMDYAGEWASNFDAGLEGDPAGFTEAARKADSRLRNYLAENKLSDPKIWVCGYSRAGAVANLVGRYLNETPEEYGINKDKKDDNLYIYTFEAPRCSADDTVYKNIHNIMDINDLVPRVYPESYGLHLNGVTEKIGSATDTVMTKMFDINAEGYVVDYKERPKHVVLDQFEDFIESAATREDYVTYLEPHLTALSSIIFAKSNSERLEILSLLSEVGEIIKDDPGMESVVTRLYMGLANNRDIDRLTIMITGALDTARESLEPPLSDEEYEAVVDAVQPLVTILIRMGNIDSCYEEMGDNDRKVYISFYNILSFATNVMEFVEPHLPWNVFKLLKEQDPYYTAGIRIKPGNIYIGDTCFTYAEYGGPLEDIALSFGFSQEEVNKWLRNGFDLHIDSIVTEIEPDEELYFRAAGMVDKSMNMYKYYEVTMTKTLGYRTYPVDTPVNLKYNTIGMIIPKELAERCFRFAVVRVDDKGAARVDRKIIKLDNGDVELRVECTSPAVYATAFDDHRWWTSADVDKDDEVSSIDATHIQRYLAKMEDFDDYQMMAGDVDSDGEVTSIDATYIQRWLSRMSAPGSIGEKFGDYEE